MKDYQRFDQIKFYIDKYERLKKLAEDKYFDEIYKSQTELHQAKINIYTDFIKELKDLK